MYLPLASGKFCASVNKNLRQSRYTKAWFAAPSLPKSWPFALFLHHLHPEGQGLVLRQYFLPGGAMLLTHWGLGLHRCMHPWVAQRTHTGTHVDPRQNVSATCMMHTAHIGTYLHFLHPDPLICLADSSWCSGLSLHCTSLEKSLLISLHVCYMSLLCTTKTLLSPF